MKCKDCEYLAIIEEPTETIIGQIHCGKYNLSRVCGEVELEYLNCVECQRNFKEVVGK